MRKTIILMIACACLVVGTSTQRGSSCLSFSAGLLYKNGLDVMLTYGHEMNYHRAQGLFANDYLRWAEYESYRHICPESFWQNYRTYGFGVVCKPCVTKGRNHYGSLRIGASGGSDTRKFLAGLHFSCEHNYVLQAGWTLYWRVKGDVMVKGANVLRTGIAPGIKLSVR